MDRPKLVALITGIVSIALAVLYLALVLVLDHRSGLAPAPVAGSVLGMVRPPFTNELALHARRTASRNSSWALSSASTSRSLPEWH